MQLFDKTNSEYYRQLLQLYFNRNENLASYIRLTNGAIWGFVALTFYNMILAHTSWYSWPLFFGIFCLTMFVWRWQVMAYQESIVDGYKRMAHCEEKLNILYRECNSRHFLDRLPKGKRPCNYYELIRLLSSERYYNPNHNNWNLFAFILSWYSLLFLGVYSNHLFKHGTYYNHLLLIWCIVLILWIPSWFYYIPLYTHNK